jgi:hypothetical protein
MDKFHTTVEVRSRWQISPETVFASNGNPREVEAKWPSNSELVIRYASGFPPNRDHYSIPLSCLERSSSGRHKALNPGGAGASPR